ncbi:MAG: DnaJ domain-containing protein [Candidatus Geothermincolia bacterium]
MTEAPEHAGAIGFLTTPDLLRDFFLRKATGQFVAYQGETIKKVYFKSGFILFATSNLTADRLGDVLLARGMITRDQFDESTRQVLATGRKQGTILVRIGALAPNDLFRGLIAQVREIVVSLCSWDQGSWRFLQGLPPQEEIVSLRLHPAGLIFEGLSLIAADRRWSGVWDPRQLELLPAADAPLALEQIDAPETVRRLYALVAQGCAPQEMAQLVGRDAKDTAVLLYGLALLGLIKAQPRPAAQPAATGLEPAATVKEEPARDDEAIRALREKVAAQMERLASLTLYQVLGVTPESDSGTIKRSYISIAKEFHPDRFFRPEFADLQEAVNAIFMRVNEAYSTLQDPAARAEYDREVLRLTTAAAQDKAPPEDSRLASEQFTKGLALLNSGDLWSGIQALRWAVNLAPQNPRYHTWLGVALMRTKKRLHEAEEHCKTAIALDYNNAQYYVHLGQVYKTGHLFEKAKKQFETALRLDPKHPGALKEIRELEPPPETGLLGRILGK